MGSTSTGKTRPRERAVASFLLTSGPVISPTFPSLVRGLQRVVKSPKRWREPEWVRRVEGKGLKGWVGGVVVVEGDRRGGEVGLGWGGVVAEGREEEGGGGGSGGGSGGGGGSDELKVASCLSRVMQQIIGQSPWESDSRATAPAPTCPDGKSQKHVWEHGEGQVNRESVSISCNNVSHRGICQKHSELRQGQTPP